MLECHSQLITRGHLPNILFIDGSPNPLLFLQGAQNDNGLSTYTFASQNLGAPSADRRIVVSTKGIVGGGGTVTSATIGGVSATIHLNNSITFGSVATFSAIVPTGATGDIVVNWSKTQNNCSIIAYSVKGESSPTPAFATSDTSSPLDITPSISGKTAVIGFGASQSGGAHFTWSGSLGVVEDIDLGVGDARHSSASLVTSGSGNIVATPDTVASPSLHVVGWNLT